jgi:hypothetical protein
METSTMRQQDMDEQEKRAEEGQRRYQEWRNELLSTPENRIMYEEEGEKLDKWLASEEQETKGKEHHTSAPRVTARSVRGFAHAVRGMYTKKRGSD